jgi:hypothetical protein
LRAGTDGLVILWQAVAREEGKIMSIFTSSLLSPFAAAKASRRLVYKPRLEALEERTVLSSWSEVAPLPTSRRSLGAAAGVDGRIYAIGGFDDNFGSVNTVEALTLSTSPNWSTVASLSTARERLAAATGRDGLIYAIGGLNGSVALNTVEAYSPFTNSWSTVASLNTARADLATVVGADGRIYAIGGDNGGVALNTVEAYSPFTNTWSTVAPMPSARQDLAAVAGADGQIYAIGGENDGVALNTVEAYSPFTNTWSTVASMPTARDDLAAVAGANGQIYAIGGSNGAALNTVEAYNPFTNTWSTVASLPTARAALSAAAGADGQIYAIGGSGNGGILNTVEAYNLFTNTWSTIASLPTARNGLAAAAGVDGRIYAIGGYNSGVLNTVESMILVQASPTLLTTPSPASAALGTGPAPILTDSAVLRAGYFETSTSSTITFTLYLGSSSTPVDTETVRVSGNGTYTTPAGYTLPAAGTGTYQWDVTFSGDANNNPASDNNDPTEQVTVNLASLASPTLVSTPSPASTTLPGGDPLFGGPPVTTILMDSAVLSGGNAETGTITFTLYQLGIVPGGFLVDTETVPVSGNGTYTTPTGFSLANAPITAVGTYQWDASYSGDPNNNPASDNNGPKEQVRVNEPPVAQLSNPALVPGTSMQVSLTVSASDFSPFNQGGGYKYTITWGDGNTSTILPTSNNGNGVPVTHPYSSSGYYLVQLTAQDQLGDISVAVTALVLLSIAPSDNITISGVSSNGQVSVTSAAGSLTPANPIDLILASGQGGSDTYTVNFSWVLGTPITITGGGATSGDTLVLNGDSSAANEINKLPGEIDWFGNYSYGFTGDTVYRSGIPNSVINVNGTGSNVINDPGGNTIINGGPGTNTITITATSGNGVAINGGPNANNYIIDMGSLLAPVTINAPAGSTSAVTVNGPPGSNVLTLTPTQLTGDGEIINLNLGTTASNLTVAGGGGSNDQLVVQGIPPGPLTAQSLAPTVGAITGPPPPTLVSTTVPVSAGFTNLDGNSQTAVWNWGDGSTSAGTVNQTGTTGTVSGSHVYAAVGIYTITLTVTDSTGGGASTAIFTLDVLKRGVTQLGTQVFIVGGNTTNDQVQVSPVGSSTTGSTGVQVKGNINGVATTTTINQTVTALVIYDFNGNDTFQLANSLTMGATISAGNGNDTVQAGNGNITVTLGNGNDTVQLGNGNDTVTLGNGNDNVQLGNGANTVTLGNGNDTALLGNGNNVVVTGNGTDTIQAGNGDNLIAAGLGQHTVQVGNGSNILIDGTVTLTQSGDSLRQVLSDWISYLPTPTQANIANIRSRLHMTYNTSHANTLLAGSGLDWFWETYAKDTTNRKATDLLN